MARGLDGAWRRAFLRTLARTGNAKLAAKTAGVDKGTAYDLRKRDPDFAARWEAAKAKGQAHVERQGPLHHSRRKSGDGPPARSEELILRRTKNGPQMIRASALRWNRRTEDAFFDCLGRTACLARAAEASGFSREAIDKRRKNYPEFDERIRAAEIAATERLWRLVVRAGIASLDPEAEGLEAPKVSIGEAIASEATAFVYSGAYPDGLRGPEHHLAWCDELAKWARPEETWMNLQLGLRCGERPRTLVTTTPRTVKALTAILGEEEVTRTGGPSRANPHQSEAGLAAMERMLGGTRLGRQELEGELIEDLEGVLWKRSLIEASRVTPLDFARGERRLARVVVGVDPPASAQGDACGIVVCGLGADGLFYVLADLSVAGLSPEGWARKVAAAAEAWGAQRVVAEKNNGGEMVGTVLRSAGWALPVTLVHAADGKAARAEPVAVLFESGRAKFAGRFPELEDELAGLTYRGGYEGPGRSPDRADAMVWAMTELTKPPRAEPRVLAL